MKKKPPRRGVGSYGLTGHQPDLIGCQRPVAGFKLGNSGWPDPISRIFNLLATFNLLPHHMHDHLAHLQPRGRCAALHNGIDQGAKVPMRDLGQLLIAELGLQFPFIDRTAHVAGWVGNLVAT